VVLDADDLNDKVMQRLATRFGLDTAFVVKPITSKATMRIRYFVPEREMGVSGHATIAAVTVAIESGRYPGVSRQNGSLTIETSSGAFELEWTRQQQGIAMSLAQNPPSFGPSISLLDVASTLNASIDDIDVSRGPVQSVSVSRPKLLVPMRNWRVLNRLSPDFEALWELCDTHNVTGLYPFARLSDKENVHAEARQFPYRAGFPEDPATGVAAAALGAYLARHDMHCASGHHEFRIAQGFAMGAPSVIDAIVDCSGGAVTATAIRGVASTVRTEAVRL
jgi:PhzF family phenazine biosynthesis protein